MKRFFALAASLLVFITLPAFASRHSTRATHRSADHGNVPTKPNASGSAVPVDPYAPVSPKASKTPKQTSYSEDSPYFSKPKAAKTPKPRKSY